MKHEIEIPGLPEGYMAVGFRLPKKDEQFFDDDEKIVKANFDFDTNKCLIVEKIKPRERKFVCVSETPRMAVDGEYYECEDGSLDYCETETGGCYKIFREVTEES